MAKNKYSAERFASWREIIRKTGVDEMLGNDALRREVFDPPLSTAGKLLGLDAAKPGDAALMLRLLAYTLFPPKQKRSGRPKNTKKWGSLKLLDLAFHRKEVARDLPWLSDKKATVEIKKRHPERYRDTTPEQMRQMMRAARSSFDQFMFEEKYSDESWQDDHRRDDGDDRRDDYD